MIPAKLNLNDAELDLNKTQSLLDRLERHEWWRWGIAAVIMLALTLGLFALSIPGLGGRNWMEQSELNIELRSLLGVVLLFDLFVIYQQVLITRLRRDLAIQLRVVTMLDTLKKAEERADADANSPQRERRRSGRAGLDRRVRVNTVLDGKPTCVYGWIRNISKHGMGAVIPCALPIDRQVTLEFSMEDGQEEIVPATVCHSQGFQYGFTFVSVESPEGQAITGRCG